MLRLRLRPDRLAPSAARRALDRFEGRIGRRTLEDVRLLVSELVTNSVRHAGLGPDGWIELRVIPSPSSLRVEVLDSGPGFRFRPQDPKPRQTSGWGLFIVDRIADRWGVIGRRPTQVWFEVADRPDGRKDPSALKTA